MPNAAFNAAPSEYDYQFEVDQWRTDRVTEKAENIAERISTVTPYGFALVDRVIADIEEKDPEALKIIILRLIQAHALDQSMRTMYLGMAYSPIEEAISELAELQVTAEDAKPYEL